MSGSLAENYPPGSVKAKNRSYITFSAKQNDNCTFLLKHNFQFSDLDIYLFMAVTPSSLEA